LADYDKLQSNIIDNQKMYESIVLNNTFNTFTRVFGGINRKEFTFENAPFDNSKLTRVLLAFL